MKRKLLLFTFLFIFFECIAQNGQYIPFPKEMIIYVSVCRGNSEGVGYGSSRLEIYGDTLLNGKKYSKCFFAESECKAINTLPPTDLKDLNKLIGGIRDEIASKKVYFYSFATNQEELLYDFDLHLGDTLFKDEGCRFYRSLLSKDVRPPKIDTVWVSRIDSVLMPHDGRYHKRFNFKTRFRYLGLDTIISSDSVCQLKSVEIKINPLIEGVGIDFDPITKFSEFEYLYNYTLYCRTVDGKKANKGPTSIAPFMFTDYCKSIVSGIDKDDSKTDIIVYPNPSNGSFELITSISDFISFEIVNCFGVKIQDKLIDKREISIDLSAQAAGIYFIKVYNRKGEFEIKKISIN